MASEGARKSQIQDKNRRRFRSDGKPIWGQRQIEGPGIWVTCVKGKEKQTVGELYDLFESLANDLWPSSSAGADGKTEDGTDEDPDEDEDIEKQIAKEVAFIKRPRKEQRFANANTNTNCVVFISCKLPVDPVKLVVKYIQDVAATGITRTRYAQRFIPVAATCVANLAEIRTLSYRIVLPFFAEEPEKTCCTYKIELRIRNHNILTRSTVLEELAKCVPEGHKVDLEHPEVFILVEIFKSVCGMSVVKDYYRLQKFNVMEIANTQHKEPGQGETGRIA